MREVEEVKRDPEIIRQILLLTEADESNPMEIVQIEIDGVTDEVVSYHIELLANAGYLTAQKFTGLNRYQWRAKSLTWEGHELLGAIKDDTVWKDTKKKLSKVGGWTLPVLQSVASEVLMSSLR